MAEEGRALFEYSRRGKLEDVREELARGESPDSYFSYDGSTALLVAARGGHVGVVAALLEARADLTVRSEDGSDALLHAASGGSSDVIQTLLASLADPRTVNEDEVSPLILAAHYGHSAAMKVLLQAQADPNYVAPGWGSALDSARGQCVTLLLQHGACRQDAPAQASSRPKAGEHFMYNCLDDDPNQAEAALRQFARRESDNSTEPAGMCRRHQWLELSRTSSRFSKHQLESLLQFHRINPLAQAVLLDLASQLPLKQLREMSSLFESMDKDGNGMLDQAELAEGLRLGGLAPTAAADTAERLAKGAGGRVEFSRFVAALAPSCQELIDDEHLRSSFNRLDANGDGYVSRCELQRLLERGSKASSTPEDKVDANRREKAARSAQKAFDAISGEGRQRVSFESFRRHLGSFVA
ncbi:Asb14 [Symbiodinium sp. CCMP2456]|nr:Asb14 [Symbiodinium sp. CCMP2456]